MISTEIETYFYNSIKTCSWPSLYYGVFSDIINENNYKVVAEVGCGYGQHSKHILKTTNVQKLFMIDSYKYYDNDGFSEGIKNVNVPGYTLEKKFDDFSMMVAKDVSEFGERVQFVRASSLEAANHFPDEILDAIFVDANHTFEYVIDDLNTWWSKVKPGGIMAGDDYWMEDVEKAVKLFAQQHGLTVQFRIKEGTDYKIFYFKK